MGALKAAAMPPAAPAATSARTRWSESRTVWPTSEPRPAPICTDGSSGPTGAKSQSSADARALTGVRRRHSRPPASAAASHNAGYAVMTLFADEEVGEQPYGQAADDRHQRHEPPSAAAQQPLDAVDRHQVGQINQAFEEPNTDPAGEAHHDRRAPMTTASDK